MQAEPSRQIIVLIYDIQAQEYLFEGDSQQNSLLSFTYNPSFDAWDNLALGRFLYQKLENVVVDTDLKIVSMLQDENFKDLLGLINKSQVVYTQGNQKCFYLETNKLNNLNKSQNQSSKQIVSTHYNNLIQSLNSFNQVDKEIIENYIINKIQDIAPKKTYCILEDAANSDTTLRHINQAMFQGLYQEENEVWKYYKVFKGEYPSQEDFDLIEGFTITGSASTAYIKEHWYDQYQIFLQKVIDSNKRILGICFGHQVHYKKYIEILAQFFGGSTALLQNIPQGYHNVFGIQKVKFVGSDNYFQVFVHHGDNVTNIPTGSRLIMTSDYCAIQAYAGQNILGVQFHPEFNIPIIKYLMTSSTICQNSDELIKSFDSSSTVNNLASLFLRGLFVTFLKTGRLDKSDYKM